MDGRFVRLYQQLSPLTLHSHNRTELRRNCWKMALIVFYCVWCCCWFTMRNIKLLTIPNDVQKPTKFVLFKTSYLFCCLFVTLTPIGSVTERNGVTASAGVWLSLCLACCWQPFLLGSCSTCQMFCLIRMKRLWMNLETNRSNVLRDTEYF